MFLKIGEVVLEAAPQVATQWLIINFKARSRTLLTSKLIRCVSFEHITGKTCCQTDIHRDRNDTK